MSDGDYLVGLAFFAVTVGGVLLAAELVVRRRMPALAGSARLVAVAILATGGLLAAHLIPGALTILTRETAAAAALLLLGGAWLLPAAPPVEPVRYPEPAIDHGPADRLLARLGVAVGAIWMILVALREVYREPVGFDAASAYMPTAARWAQEGSIWGITDWLPDFFFGASPGNGSVVVLAGILPWDNDFVARYAIFPFVALTALATYGIARELRAPWTAAALIGLMIAAAPVVVQPALNDALLDPVLYAGAAAGGLFLLRHHRTESNADLLVAGIALGIAFGTKFYGFSSVPIVIAVWVAARLLARVPPRTVARQAAAVGGLIAAFGGIWVLRNLIETGNPIFPVSFAPLGISIFTAPADPLRDSLGATLFGYLDEPSVWTGELRHQFRIATGIPLLLLGASVLGAVALLVRRRRWGADDRSDGPAMAAIAAAVLLALAYMLTPYSAVGPPGDPNIAAANVRYGIPAMIAAAAAAGFVAGRLGRRGLLGFEMLALLGMLDAIWIGQTALRSTLYTAVALATAVVVCVWLIDRLASRASLSRSTTRRLVAGSLAALMAVVAIASIRWQETYNAGRYVFLDEALGALIERTEAEPAMVALAGSWTDRGVAPIYPAFGTRLQNEVTYIGPIEDGLLGTFERGDEFRSALSDGEHSLLLIGCRDCPPGPLAGSREARWAAAEGYRPLVRSERLLLMGADG